MIGGPCYTFQQLISCCLSIDSQTTLLPGDLDVSIDLELFQSVLEESAGENERFAKCSPVIIKLTR